MARTARDLTAEELRMYRPGPKFDEQQMAERWEQAWKVARAAAHLLREKFEAKRVVVFGSLVHRDWFSPWSDIDLATWGIPPERFYRAVAAVTSIHPDFEVDLVDPKSCRPSVLRFIEREGVDL